MVIDQLLSDGLVHAREGIVGAGEISLELGEGVDHQLLLLQTLLLGDAGGETEALNAATNTDADRLDWDVVIDVTVDFLNVHVAGVLGISADSMVLLDQGIEDLGEILVRVLVSSVDTAVLVVKLDSTGDGLGEGEARCCCLVPRQLRNFSFN